MKFDFSGRLQAAFGFVAATTATRLAQKAFGDVVKKSDLNVDVYVMSREATFDEVTLYSGSETYHFAYRSMAEQYSEVFATPPMLSLKRAKKLVITPIDNSDIEVVERYGTEPYEITWRGLLIDMENHEFPIDKMEALNRIFEASREWMVSSEILQKVGVLALYIRDIQIDFVEGFEDTIAYTMTTRAIRPVELQLDTN
ncbi:MAG: hypothetical protein A2066_18875 [Bacteroidetes bacterium GWB2_41_8]|nr:MAG: hypothetical protein A2066_18875 [Bacteroidetes bacterium GWB2_41_8]